MDALHTKYCDMKMWFKRVRNEIQMQEKVWEMHEKCVRKHDKCMQTWPAHHCCKESSPSLNYTTKLCRLLNTDMVALNAKYGGMKTWFSQVRHEIQKHEKASATNETQPPHHCCCESSPLNYTTKLCRSLNSDFDDLHIKYHDMKMWFSC